MNIVIDLEDPAPPFAQLIAQIKEAVQRGGLSPGDALPSIRRLAREVRGTFVHPDARENSAVDLTAWVEEELSRAIASFRDAGVTDTEIRNVFQRLLSGRHS